MVKIKSVIIVAVLAVFVANLASAAIIVSQPKFAYSIGDDLDVDVTLNPSQSINDFLTVKIDCGDNEKVIYQAPYSVVAGGQKIAPIEINLGGQIVQGLQGTCVLDAKYGSESAVSQQFELSRNINVDVEVDGTIFEPGAIISVKGTAKKINGQNAQGFVEILVDMLSASGSVTAGAFSINATLPPSIAPGEHDLIIRIYEKYNDEITNNGTIVKKINIREVLKGIEIGLDESSVEPGEEMKYLIFAFDQAGNAISRDVSYSVYEPNGKMYLKKTAKTGEKNSLDIDSNFTAGYWKIEAESEGLIGKKLFFVEEKEEIEFILSNGTLFIKNLGNTIYNKPVSISIGEQTIVKDIMLKIGEEKRFKLSAPDSEYLVSVSDGNSNEVFNSVPLTGRVVALNEDSRLAFNLNMLWPIVLLASLLVLGAVIRTYIRKKRNGGGSIFRKSRVKEFNVGDVTMGNKENAGIIALKLKRLNNELFNDTYSRISKATRDSGAYVNREENHDVIALPSSQSKEENMAAVRLARDIEKELSDYNRKAKEKTNFGIGVGSGEIIVQKDMQGARFTGSGTSIGQAKRMSNSSKEDVMLSDEVYKKIMTGIRAEKSGDGWKLLDIKDRGKYDSFLKDFMKK